jgi:predicted nucleic acid-binding protein
VDREGLQVVTPVVLDAHVCRDPDDDVVLGTAVAGKCEAIVTGDKDLLDLGSYEGIVIVSPRTFWGFEALIAECRPAVSFAAAARPLLPARL